MKILLANPPWDKGGIRAGSRWAHTDEFFKEDIYRQFPTFLCIAAAVLEKDNHNVSIIDSLATNQTQEDFLSDVLNFNPDIIVIESSTASLKIDISISKILKKLTRSKIIFTGPHVSARPEDVLNEEIDFCIIGEYEYALRELAKGIEQNSDIEKITGIAFYKNGDLINTGRRELISNLDELPFPAFHLVDMKKYYTPFSRVYPAAEVITSRGCPFKCIFCLWPQVLYNSSGVRFRSAKNVVDEIEILHKKYGNNGIYFNDDTFTISKKHVLGICEEMKKRNLTLPWACFGHIKNLINAEDLLQRMKESGCRLIKFGIESGSQKILNNIKKEITLEQIKEVVRLVKKAGIGVHCAFLIGLPGETRETVEETVNLSRELKLNSLVFAIATPYPGTKFYEMAEKKGWIEVSDWTKYDGNLFPVIHTDGLTNKEIKEAFEYAKSIYAVKRLKNPQYILKYFYNTYQQRGFFPFVKSVLKRIPWFFRKISILLRYKK